MRCILCNNDSTHEARFKQIYPQANQDSILLNWFECKSCKGLFNYPHPSAEEIGKYWQTIPYNDPEKEEEYLQDKKYVYNKILSLAGNPGRKILDFGSNFGQFLDLAKSQGWETYGFEPNEEGVNISKQKGHHMYTGFEIDRAIPKDSRFHVLVANDSFCYVWHPYNTLAGFYQLLENDGKLIMRLSNKRTIIQFISSLYKEGYKRNRLVSKILQAQFHSIHVNELKQICLELGFRKVKIKIGANTAPFHKQSLFTNCSYFVTTTLYYITLGVVNISPGVLFVAEK